MAGPFAMRERTSGFYTAALHDAKGIPIDASTLTSLTLSLYEVVTGPGTPINGRDSQNVLNLNNVTVGNTTTIVSSASGSPGIFTTSGAHGLVDQSVVTIRNHVGAVPNVSGTYLVNVIDATSFSLAKVGINIPVNLTVGGSSGTVTGGLTWSIQPADNQILLTDKPIETHVALFTATWDSGAQQLEHEVLLTVANLQKVT